MPKLNKQCLECVKNDLTKSGFIVSNTLRGLVSFVVGLAISDQSVARLTVLKLPGLSTCPALPSFPLGTFWGPETGREVIYRPICLRIHSSSASSFAELRFSGSHCNILRIIRRNLSLSSPSRVVSLCSSGVRSCNKAASRNSPESEKSFWLCLPRARRLGGGWPRRLIISARCARLRYVWNLGSWPVNKEHPSKMFQICGEVRGGFVYHWAVCYLTMHPTFQMSIL